MSTPKNYDAAFCGSLPIHHINQVQPYGVLLVLDKEQLTIVQVSENTPAIFTLPVTELVGQSLRHYLDVVSLETLQRKASSQLRDKIPVTLQINGKKYLSLLHSQDNFLLLEVELVPAGEEVQHTFVDIYQEVKYAMAAIDQAGDIEEVCEAAAEELKQLSGFDKVMIYRFDEQWNGTVLAEVKEPGMEAYLGLTFPASDIPKQARELYRRSPYRFIPDREYIPVKLHPVINPVTHAFIDLSQCNMRGVAAVHLEYLKNMQVKASMSTRILLNDQLWGLIACHHTTPRWLGYEMCSVFELLSNVLSARITSLYNKEQLDSGIALNQRHAKLLEQIYCYERLDDGFSTIADSLLQLFDAGGVVLVQEDRMRTHGKVPGRDELADLVFWLNTKELRHVFQEQHLAGVYDQAAAYAPLASGILVIPFNIARQAYLIVFRPEVVQTINWGGNPDEAIRFEADGKNYHPRHSFTQWQQTVKQTAAPWRPELIRVAENIRSFLYEYTTKQM